MIADLRKMARRSGWLASAALAAAIGWRTLAIATLVLLGAAAQPVGAEQVDYTHFDHMSTGFPLDGRHLNLKCEQCHLNGVFEGTPSACHICHIQGNPRSAVYMPTTHIPLESTVLNLSSAECSTCHVTQTFQNAHFPHSEAKQGSCPLCHNGVNATGKNKGHIATTASCDACHSTVSFLGAYAVYPLGHIPTTLTCSVCHTGGFSLATTQMVHAGITGACTTCHAADAPATAPIVFTMTFGTSNGQPVILKPTSQNYHPPTSSSPTHFTVAISCQSCHAIPSAPMAPTAAAGGFAGGKMNHAGITTGCAGCHADGAGPFIGVTGLVLESTKGPHIPIATTACENCHKSTTVPGGFAGTAMVHTGLTDLTPCASCHENNATDLGYYGLTAKLVVRPPTSGTPPNAVTPVDANHPTMGDCSQCHQSTTSFNANIAKPSNHIPTGTTVCTNCHLGSSAPYAPANTAMNHTGFTATCAGCHGTGLSFYGTAQSEAGGQPLQPPGTVGTAGAANHIPYAGADCVSCHAAGSNAQGGFKITTVPALSAAGHTAVKSVACGTCHASATDTWYGVTAVTTGATHIPMASADCGSCHVSSSFAAGGFKITTSPVLNVAAHTAVASLTCVSCHENNATDLNFQGVLAQIYLRPGATAAGLSPVDNTHATGLLGTADCAQCHNTTPPFKANQLPSAHIPLPSPQPACGTCHAAGYSPTLSKMVHSVVTSETCTTCHGSGKGPFSGSGPGTGGQPVLPPGTLGTSGSGNHIPVSGADCVACHASTDTESGTGFKTNTTPALSATGHTAVNALSCQSCHAAGMAWFGVSTLVTPGATHIPMASAGCTSCHASNFVAGGFKITTAPVLNVAAHTAVASLTCVSCHENNATDLNFQGVLAQIYVRPGALAAGLSPVDANHATGQLATADCTQCHNTTPPFTGSQLPTNHIPLGASPAACATCHAGGYGVGKSIMVHTAVTSETCTTCHAVGKGPFAGTSQGTGGQPKQPPGTPATFPCSGTACNGAGGTNHIPIPGSSDCKACHATKDAMTGTGFAGSAINHSGAGIASSCAGCHNAGNAFYGVTIKTNTLTPPHIPVGTTPTCEACHSASNFTAFGPGTAMNPTTHLQVPTTLETCATCHETGDATKYYGVTIVVRPTATQDANHPPTGDCGGCHTTTPPFTGNVKPANHIPSSATCTNCHTGYTPATTTMSHTDSVVAATTCATCHNYNAGPYYGTAQGQAGGQPLQPGGTLNGPAATTQHIPFNAVACNTCHSSTTVPGGFATGTVPHTSGGGFMTYTRGSGQSNTGSSTPKCVTCHAPGGAKWQNASISTATMGSHHGSSTTADCIDCHGATGGGFGGAAAAAKAVRLIAKATGGLTARPSSTPSTTPAGTPANTPTPATGPTAHRAGSLPGVGPYSHAGVAPGSCVDCHRAGGTATAMPGSHLPTTLVCSTCHRTMAWVPATYAHDGVGPGRCVACHGGPGTWATPKPSNHFVTARSCDLCHHRTTNWLPATYDHLSPRYRPQTGIVRCLDCHATNTEVVVPLQTRAIGRKAVPGGPSRPQ